jgi:hypothetical protein
MCVGACGASPRGWTSGHRRRGLGLVGGGRDKIGRLSY